jgi:hypothetical protein
MIHAHPAAMLPERKPLGSIRQKLTAGGLAQIFHTKE